ncbi:MAG: HAMP domain-containing sensor histidine kinase, partial [bacterium]
TEILTVLIILGLLLDALLSDSWQKMILKIIVVALVAYGGYLLIRNVLDEIKKRKRLQELTNELKTANKRLAELDALKTEFVSMASHELLTPISAIQGYLHMILEEKIIPLTDSKAEGILRKVYGSSNRLARLVTDLLNVSRIESGRLIVEKQVFDINQVIQITVSELKIKAQEKNLKIVWSPLVHPRVVADKDKLKQVMTNIIGNAIKYTEKGQIEIATSVKKDQSLGTKLEGSGNSMKRITQKGDFVVMQVKDTGVGIPKEEIRNIFQKFHRIGDWKTRNTQGTGLGLYIAKNITEMMSGKIWVKSEYGHGSTFSFSVPIAKDDTINKDKHSE